MTKNQKTSVDASQASLSGKAFDVIEEMIVTRRLAPGSMLSESDLVEELSIGRTPVREALARLEWFGLVEIHPRRGIRVSSIDVMRHLELLEVRLPLECAIVRHVVDRATDGDLEDLRSAMQRLTEAAQARNHDAYFRAKRLLHEIEVRASYNPVLTQTMRSLHAQSRRFWLAYETVEMFTDAAERHERIVRHVCDRDAEGAVKAVEDLFGFLEQITKKALDRRRPG